MLKIHSMNLFTAWEVEAPKVGAPSSHVMSLGPLFIGDVLNGWLLWFLVETIEEGFGKHKKNFGKKNSHFYYFQKFCLQFVFK